MGPIGQQVDNDIRVATDNAPVLEHHTGASAISISNSELVLTGRKRKRPGRKFFFTLDLPSYYDSCRKDIVQWFDQLVTFCVAVEVSRISKRVSFHAHSYLEFSDKILLSDLRDYIDICINTQFGESLRFDLQSCKSPKSVLKYITKEDRCPYFNCKLSLLHFNYRSFVWAMQTPIFRHSDSFVQEHRFCYRYLEKLFYDVKTDLKRDDKELFRCEKAYANWSLVCANWWNESISKFVVKRKQLYLFGPSNTGKSSWVEKMIGRSMMKFVYFPGVGKFFMQGYRPGFHKVILFEEFDYKYHCSSMLKRLLEGRSYSYPVKGQMDVDICHKGPIIFVSNYDFPDMDEALRNRLFFVSAPEAFWSSLEAIVPKEEGEEDDFEEVEVIALSSDEEEEENKKLHVQISKAGF